MSFLDYGRHVRQLRCRRCEYAPTNNTLAMITMRTSTHGFPFLSHDAYGAPLGGPSGRRSSATKMPEKSSQFLSLDQPNKPKSLDVALNSAGVRKNCDCGESGGHLIRVRTERSRR